MPGSLPGLAYMEMTSLLLAVIFKLINISELSNDLVSA